MSDEKIEKANIKNYKHAVNFIVAVFENVFGETVINTFLGNTYEKQEQAVSNIFHEYRLTYGSENLVKLDAIIKKRLSKEPLARSLSILTKKLSRLAVALVPKA